jgi:hypothetical protein
MAKTAKRRAEAMRLLSKWRKQYSHPIPLSLGRVYKQDPFDCGIASCEVCKRYSNKVKGRQVFRKHEREAYNILSEGIV